MKFQSGDVIALTKCPVWVGVNPSEPTPMSGLFELIDYQPFEPSAYAWDSGWWIGYPGEDEENEPNMFVSDSDLFPQIDPKGYSRMIAQEREFEMMQEDEIMAGMQ